MREYLKFYIDGAWVDPAEGLKTLDVENPATEEVCCKIALGSAADVDKAAKAARKAFATWSQTSREERLEVLGRILTEYQKRFGDLATAVVVSHRSGEKDLPDEAIEHLDEIVR